MAKIRHEINILDAPLVQSSTTTDAWSNEKFFSDNSKFNGTVSTFLEVIYTNTCTTNASVGFGTTTSSGAVAMLSPNVTTPTLVRSGNNVFTLGNGASPVDWGLVVLKLTSAGTVTIKSARLVIIQDTGTSAITASETQIEIGNNEQAKTVTTTSTLQPLTNPKYWYYDASKWDGQCTFAAEVSWLVSSTTGNKTIVVQQSDGTGDGFQGWTTVATMVNAASGATTVARVRSTAFTPVDGRNYRLAWTNSSTMTTVSIFNAKIIVTQAPTTTGSAVVPSFSTSNTSSYAAAAGSAFTICQSFQGNGKYLTSVFAAMIRTGSPTGNITCTLQGHNGTFGNGNANGATIATSTTLLNVATISTTPLNYSFTFPATYLDPNTYYTAVFDVPATANQSSSNYISFITGNTAGSSAPGNYAVLTSSWLIASSFDLYHTINTYDINAITKLQEQYLMLNTPSSVTPFNYPTQWNPSEWTGTNYMVQYAAEAPGGSAITALKSVSTGNSISGSQIISVINQVISNNTLGIPSGASSGYVGYSGSAKGVGQSFVGNGKKLTKARFSITRTGTVTGTLVAKIYAHSGTYGTSSIPTGSPLATSTNTISIGNLPSNTTANYCYFNFDGTFVMVNGTNYIIAVEATYTSGDSTNNITFVQSSASASYHAGNGSVFNSSSVWNPISGGGDIATFVEEDIGFSLPATADTLDGTNPNVNTFNGSRIIISVFPSPDTTAPSVPTGLTEISTTYNSTTVSWTASTDDVGVAGYDVAVDGVYNKTVTATNATITGLNYLTTYSITVRAKDAVGNTSAYSTALSITTPDRPPLNLNGNFFLFFN